MTRLSFAIVVLLYFNPVTQVWRRLIEQPPYLHVSALTVRLISPYVGLIYLIVLAVLSWALIALLLFVADAYLRKRLSRQPAFRDGVTLASGPSLVFVPEVAAKILFWILLVMALIGALAGLLLTIPVIAALLGSTGLVVATAILNAIRGGSSGPAVELMMLALCFLWLILKPFFYMEKDAVHFAELRRMQTERFRAGRGLDPVARGLMRGEK